MQPQPGPANTPVRGGNRIVRRDEKAYPGSNSSTLPIILKRKFGHHLLPGTNAISGFSIYRVDRQRYAVRIKYSRPPVGGILAVAAGISPVHNTYVFPRTLLPSVDTLPTVEGNRSLGSVLPEICMRFAAVSVYVRVACTHNIVLSVLVAQTHRVSQLMYRRT